SRAELDALATMPGAALALEAAPGWALGNSCNVASEPAVGVVVGTHGFLPSRPTMATGFIAAGAGIRRGVALERMRLIDIAPHAAESGDDTLFAELERLAAFPRVVAIGEMGLDFFRNLSPRDVQESVLRRQLALARALRKPALIHCRDAHAETLAVLAEERVQDVGGIMHCFSGDVEIARRCLDLGL